MHFLSNVSCFEAKIPELERHAANMAFYHSSKYPKGNEFLPSSIVATAYQNEVSCTNHQPVAVTSNRPTPAQERVISDLNKLNSEVSTLEALESSGFATKEQICLLKTKLETRSKLKRQLQRLRFQAAAQKKFRDSNKNNNWRKLKQEHPELETETIGTVPRNIRTCCDVETNKKLKSSRYNATEDYLVEDFKYYDNKDAGTKVTVSGKCNDQVSLLSYNYNNPSPSRPSPAQERVIASLAKVESEVFSLQEMESSGFATKEQISLLTMKLESRNKLRSQLKRLRSQVIASKKVRDSNKNNLKKIKEARPELENQLSRAISRNTRGRPRIEEKQPLLLQTIVDLVNQNARADDDNRSESLRCCQTLNDLHVELKQHGFQLSRSALYLRLLPQDSESFDGKRHVVTVPVKLSRSETHERKFHNEDNEFVAITIKYVRDLAETFGKDCVLALSHYEKAKVPFGILAANKYNQAPLLMQMDNHDRFHTTKHKLILSVYGGLSFDESGKLSHSGPTYVAIRSGKHDTITPETNTADFERLTALPLFRQLLSRTNTENMKPIVTLFVDGATDRNHELRFAQHFKFYDLDALFVVMQAAENPNPVERRIAALSSDLSAIVLPHEHYGTHLDSSGKTIDLELETKNFKKAGECLSEVWSSNVIDGYDVFAEYAEPRAVHHDTEIAAVNVTEEWKSVHVVRSKYLLQIVKCGVVSCCGQLRTNIRDFLPNGKLPAPVRFQKCSSGVRMCFGEENEGEFSHDLAHRIAFDYTVSKCLPNIPFDYFCPSVRTVTNQKIVCSFCQSCFMTKTALASHLKFHKTKSDVVSNHVGNFDTCDSDNELPSNSDAQVDDIHIIRNLSHWMSSPFELSY